MNCLRWLAPVQCVLPLRRRLLQSAFNWCRRQKQNNHTARLLRISVVGFFFWIYWHSSVSNKQCHNFNNNHGIPFSSVAQSCLTICDPMNHSTPGLPVPELTQTHVHWVSDAIQQSHPLSSPSPPAPNPSQHQSLFQWVNSSHEVAKVLEFQL